MFSYIRILSINSVSSEEQTSFNRVQALKGRSLRQGLKAITLYIYVKTNVLKRKERFADRLSQHNLKLHYNLSLKCFLF